MCLSARVQFLSLLNISRMVSPLTCSGGWRGPGEGWGPLPEESCGALPVVCWLRPGPARQAHSGAGTGAWQQPAVVGGSRGDAARPGRQYSRQTGLQGRRARGVRQRPHLVPLDGAGQRKAISVPVAGAACHQPVSKLPQAGEEANLRGAGAGGAARGGQPCLRSASLARWMPSSGGGMAARRNDPTCALSYEWHRNLETGP